MPPTKKLSVLITGCSPGGMGEALAIVFHNAGHHVYATARTTSKLSTLSAQGIETVTLDITSTSSIEAAVAAVSSSLPDGKGLNILINNAGGNYTMPVVDTPLDAARKLFDTNVWAQIAVTQAFLPLLLKSTTTSSTGNLPANAMIVNHTSGASLVAIPFQSVYNASKAALAMFSETMRMELSPFGIRVIDLKTAAVLTNILNNSNTNVDGDRLPEGSIYMPAREIVEKIMSQEGLIDDGITAEQWATQVMGDLLCANPPNVIWRGHNAYMVRLMSLLPTSLFEIMIWKTFKMNVVESIIKESRKEVK